MKNCFFAPKIALGTVVLIVMTGIAIAVPTRRNFAAEKTETVQQSSVVLAYQQGLRAHIAEFNRIETRKESLKKEMPVNDGLFDALTQWQSDILKWMRRDAAQIPGDVPRDVQIFLGGR